MPLPVHSPAARRRGVTLIEVVIAIFVLSVGILGVMALFPTGYSLSQGAIDRSIGALAARDALARIMIECKRGTFTFPSSTQSFADTRERDRVGTVGDGSASPVSTNSLRVVVRGNDTTPEWHGVAGRYLVLTSGTAAGSVFPITGTGTNTITCGGVEFRTGTSRTGIRVRVGDHFAIIGSQDGRRCYPLDFLTTGPGSRTIPIAATGSESGIWPYSYGCIISAPSPEMKRIHRIDVFVYRGFVNQASIEDQEQPVAHYVTYVSDVEPHTEPDE